MSDQVKSTTPETVLVECEICDRIFPVYSEGQGVYVCSECRSAISMPHPLAYR